MPGLTFPITPDGLLVSAMIGHDRTQMQALQAAGVPLPAPLHVRALLDTGSDHTAVGPSTLAALGVSSGKTVQTRTAGGPVSVRIYTVSLTIHDPAAPGGAAFFRPAWTVTNLDQDLPDAEILIGMDLIREFLLIVDGRGQQFTLLF